MFLNVGCSRFGCSLFPSPVYCALCIVSQSAPLRAVPGRLHFAPTAALEKNEGTARLPEEDEEEGEWSTAKTTGEWRTPAPPVLSAQPERVEEGSAIEERFSPYILAFNVAFRSMDCLFRAIFTLRIYCHLRVIFTLQIVI